MRNLALVYIAFRMGIDTVTLIACEFPPVLKLLQGFGWPVDNFWTRSIMPTSLVITLIAVWMLMRPKTAQGLSKFFVILMFVPFSWGIQLLLSPNRTMIMAIDASTLILVAVSGIYVWLKSRKG